MRINDALKKIKVSTKSVFHIASDIQNSDGEFTQFMAFSDGAGAYTVSLENKKRNVQRKGLTLADVVSFVMENHLAHRACTFRAF